MKKKITSIILTIAIVLTCVIGMNNTMAYAIARIEKTYAVGDEINISDLIEEAAEDNINISRLNWIDTSNYIKQKSEGSYLAAKECQDLHIWGHAAWNNYSSPTVCSFDITILSAEEYENWKAGKASKPSDETKAANDASNADSGASADENVTREEASADSTDGKNVSDNTDKAIDQQGESSDDEANENQKGQADDMNGADSNDSADNNDGNSKDKTDVQTGDRDEEKENTSKTNTDQTKETPDTTTVAAVNGLKVTASSTGLKVSWNKVADAKSYQVYRKAKGEKSWKNVKTTSTSSFADKKVFLGQKYSYRVRAIAKVNGKEVVGAFSKASKYTTVKTVAAPKLKSVKKSGKGLKITWAKKSGLTGYMIYKKVDGGKWKRVKKVKASKSTYTDKAAKKGHTYKYYVKGYKKVGKKVYLTKKSTTKTNQLKAAKPTVSAKSRKKAVEAAVRKYEEGKLNERQLAKILGIPYTSKEYVRVCAEIYPANEEWKVKELRKICEDLGVYGKSDVEKIYLLSCYFNADRFSSVHAFGHDVLFDHVGTCSSFAAGFERLANVAGIYAVATVIAPSYFGDSPKNGPHALNIVKIGNYWYPIDRTGGSAVYSGICNIFKVTTQYPYKRTIEKYAKGELRIPRWITKKYGKIVFAKKSLDVSPADFGITYDNWKR